MSKDGKLTHRELSETAENAMHRLHGTSGVMRYAVVLANGSARNGVVVEAATGDEAAEKALAKHPGWKVAYVGPATASDTIPATADPVD